MGDIVVSELISVIELSYTEGESDSYNATDLQGEGEGFCGLEKATDSGEVTRGVNTVGVI